MKKTTLLLSLTLLLTAELFAQSRRNEDKILTFETIYDARKIELNNAEGAADLNAYCTVS